jgi:hypothetical protein
MFRSRGLFKSGERRLPACSCRQLAGNILNAGLGQLMRLGRLPRRAGWQPALAGKCLAHSHDMAALVRLVRLSRLEK